MKTVPPLPWELNFIIISKVDRKTRPRCRQVCKAWENELNKVGLIDPDWWEADWWNPHAVRRTSLVSAQWLEKHTKFISSTIDVPCDDSTNAEVLIWMEEMKHGETKLWPRAKLLDFIWMGVAKLEPQLLSLAKTCFPSVALDKILSYSSSDNLLHFCEFAQPHESQKWTPKKEETFRSIVPHLCFRDIRRILLAYPIDNITTFLCKTNPPYFESLKQDNEFLEKIMANYEAAKTLHTHWNNPEREYLHITWDEENILSISYGCGKLTKVIY